MNVTSRIKNGLVSVILPCLRSKDLTELGVASLLRNCRRPWEMVAVVEGDGPIASFLRGVRVAAPIHITIVKASNLGPLKAGIDASCGDYLALIDEGTIVSDAWLEQLIALLDSRPGIGVVGPMLNDANPPQRAEGTSAPTSADVQRFADKWRSEHRGQWSSARRLADSCLLGRREILAKHAGIDVRSPGELAQRVLASGLSLAVACDLYVHHLGPESCGTQEQGHGVDMWLAPKGRGDVARKPALGKSRDPAVGLAANRPLVSLTMIVRDEEENIAGCLESAAGLFGEIVVVDTGSTDRTVEVARGFGARVVEFPWVDDFAAARNAALDHATGLNAFWLDADDRIDGPNRDKIRTILDGLGSKPVAYAMKQLSTSTKDGEATTAADHVRLFPIRDDLRWTYRVHEQILPAVRAAGIPIHWTEVGIGHVGYADPSLRRRKLDRNLRILLLELKEKPTDPFILFNIGWIAIDRHEPKTALGYLRASLAASRWRDSIVRKIYVLITRAYQMLGDDRSALAACQAGRAIEPDDAELLFREALLRRKLGDTAGAEACWRQILGLSRPSRFSSVVTGIYGHLTRRKLAQLAEERGDLSEAVRLWDEVLAECLSDPEAARAIARLNRTSTVIMAGP